ncbi:MAG: hypothetical protein KC457_27600, partial [Myxococcales bacterium]|nr:hypothetical protein [Myxococcales bacterium]
GLAAGHEILRVHGPPLAQPLFVDGWSNLAPFVLEAEPAVEDAVTLATLGAAPRPVLPGAALRIPEAPARYAEAEGCGPVIMAPRFDAPRRGADFVMQAPKLDDATLDRIEDPRVLFLFARVLHLYDDPRAQDLYRRVLTRSCPGRWLPWAYLCRGTEQLLAR